MKPKTAIWLGVAALVVLVLGANAHLVYVAVKSQPDCVAHQKPGASAGAGAGGTFSAAKSSCSMHAETDAK